ncbi:MAG: calcium/sodium antiporter [bacterium]|nr:calcium/sodium antiporter [bacterium]
MLNYIFLLVGFVLLIKGADLLVSGGSAIAKRFNISNIVIGLTIVAFGTSAPEFVVSTFAAFEGASDLSLSNIVGSVVTNVLLGLGIAAVIFPLKVTKGTVWKEIPLSVLAILVVLVLANDQWIVNGGVPQLAWTDGLVLLAFFGIFMYYTFGLSKTSSDDPDVAKSKEMSALKSGLYIVGGLVGLAYGGDLIVNNGIEIAQQLGVSEKLIGLLIVGPGTSLPEIAATAIAAKRKNVDMAVGGVVGSNIFNLFLIIGTSSIVGSLAYDTVLNVDMVLILGVSLLLFFALFVGKKHILERWQGVAFLATYAAYVVFLIIRG